MSKRRPPLTVTSHGLRRWRQRTHLPPDALGLAWHRALYCGHARVWRPSLRHGYRTQTVYGYRVGADWVLLVRYAEAGAPGQRWVLVSCWPWRWWARVLAATGQAVAEEG